MALDSIHGGLRYPIERFNHSEFNREPVGHNGLPLQKEDAQAIENAFAFLNTGPYSAISSENFWDQLGSAPQAAEIAGPLNQVLDDGVVTKNEIDALFAELEERTVGHSV